MTEILHQGPTGDGYDVRFVTADGQAYVLHWLSQPSAGEITTALATFETQLAEQAVPEYVIEAEDGTEV